jgi:hypothetical protein
MKGIDDVRPSRSSFKVCCGVAGVLGIALIGGRVDPSVPAQAEAPNGNDRVGRLIHQPGHVPDHCTITDHLHLDVLIGPGYGPLGADWDDEPHLPNSAAPPGEPGRIHVVLEPRQPLRFRIYTVASTQVDEPVPGYEPYFWDATEEAEIGGDRSALTFRVFPVRGKRPLRGRFRVRGAYTRRKPVTFVPVRSRHTTEGWLRVRYRCVEGDFRDTRYTWLRVRVLGQNRR